MKSRKLCKRERAVYSNLLCNLSWVLHMKFRATKKERGGGEGGRGARQCRWKLNTFSEESPSRKRPCNRVDVNVGCLSCRQLTHAADPGIDVCGAVVHAGALDEEVAGGQGSRSVATALLLHLFATVHAHDFVTGGGGTERSSKP